MARGDHWFRKVMSGGGGVSGAAARGTAAVLEPLYAGTMAVRNLMYDQGWIAVHRLPRPVISIGNLSAGGTGKTVVVAWLARELSVQGGGGGKVAILMRGYGARLGEKGDEQRELEGMLGEGVVVVANPDRVAGAEEALKREPGVSVFLLDDGFQHRRVWRDLDVVLVSATQGLSSGRVLPRGLLRENVEGLARADLVVVTRVDQVGEGVLQGLLKEVAKATRHVRGTHDTPLRGRRTGGAEVSGGNEVPVVLCRHGVVGNPALQGVKVFLVAGVGEPEAFRQTVLDMGAIVVGEQWFPDHHNYSHDDWASAGHTARAAGAQLVVTTGKDAVKLPEGACEMPVTVVRVQAEFLEDGGERLLNAVQNVLRA